MFLRTVKAAGGQGVQHEYVRLVEAYREDGRAKQRVVCNLGRKDLLAAHLDALIRLLRGEPVRRAAVRLGEVQATGAWDWGPMLVARALWRGLGLGAILDGQGGRGPGDGRALAGRGRGRVAHRGCAASRARSSSGTGPPTSWPRASRSSSRNSICGCAISFRSRSTSRSTT